MWTGWRKFKGKGGKVGNIQRGGTSLLESAVISVDWRLIARQKIVSL
jgi:hypothetical protein